MLRETSESIFFQSKLQEKAVQRRVVVSQFDVGLWQQWPSPSTEIIFWHTTALNAIDSGIQDNLGLVLTS